MYNDLSNSKRRNSMRQLVKGIQSLLGVLEAMKLDVANHQIRCLPPMLVEDTFHFEQHFIHKKIQTGRLDIDPARRWYDEANHCDVEEEDAGKPKRNHDARARGYDVEPSEPFIARW